MVSWLTLECLLVALKVIVVLINKEAPMHDTSFHVLVRHCGVRAL